jgi:hypothetical protein
VIFEFLWRQGYMEVNLPLVLVLEDALDLDR